jgi:hypothetical protein
MSFSMFMSKGVGDVGALLASFSLFLCFLSKDELGCCTLEKHLSDAYDEHTMW